ncbi:MAG: hypothetical protein AB7S97_06235 [Thermoplasmata archaeon]
MKMSTGTCCPGKDNARKITVGGHQIGVSFLDQIIERAMAHLDAPEEELKAILLREVKVYNYVPSSVEDEYVDALWEEFKKQRARRSGIR